MRPSLRVLVFSLSLAAMQTTAVAVKAAVVNCSRLANIEVAVALNAITTFSQTFVNVPDMTLSFTQGGTSPGCVLVRYSAEVLSSPGTSGDNDQMIVRPLLDGSIQSVPPQSDLTSDDDEDHDRRFLRAHSFEFLFASVSPGPHTIVMQWRGTQSSVMNKRSRVTTVLHR
jgi:hypothetical protein